MKSQSKVCFPKHVNYRYSSFGRSGEKATTIADTVGLLSKAGYERIFRRQRTQCQQISIQETIYVGRIRNGLRTSCMSFEMGFEGGNSAWELKQKNVGRCPEKRERRG